MFHTLLITDETIVVSITFRLFRQFQEYHISVAEPLMSRFDVSFQQEWMVFHTLLIAKHLV